MAYPYIYHKDCVDDYSNGFVQRKRNMSRNILFIQKFLNLHKNVTQGPFVISAIENLKSSRFLVAKTCFN